MQHLLQRRLQVWIIVSSCWRVQSSLCVRARTTLLTQECAHRRQCYSRKVGITSPGNYVSRSCSCSRSCRCISSSSGNRSIPAAGRGRNQTSVTLCTGSHPAIESGNTNEHATWWLACRGELTPYIATPARAGIRQEACKDSGHMTWCIVSRLDLIRFLGVSRSSGSVFAH